MKEEEIFWSVIKAFIDKGEYPICKMLYYGLLSLSRQFSIYFFNIGRKIGKELAKENFDKKEDALEKLRKILEKMGVIYEEKEEDNKIFLDIKESPLKMDLKINHLFFERGLIQGFLENSLKKYNIFTKEEEGRIVVEMYKEEEVIKKVLGI